VHLPVVPGAPSGDAQVIERITWIDPGGEGDAGAPAYRTATE
jgi:hypothetical protein